MADVITRFKLETTQYDSKLRDASKGLQAYGKQIETAGKDFTNFSQKAVEAARSLGTIASGATNTKDKLRDLVGAYNDVAKTYNKLTEQQRQTDFGKNMAASLEQLQVRIKETKQELYGLGDATKNAGGGLFGGGKLDGMLQVFGGNVMTKVAGMALGAVTSLTSEIEDAVKQGIELAKQGEGIRIAFERLNKPGLLDNLREATHGTVTNLELMKAAVKFNDFKLPVEELGTMLAFAQQKAKDTGQSIDYMVDSIVTGLGRKSLMILDNLGLSAAEIKEKMKETGDMTKAVGEIIREQMSKAGDYVETAADRATKADVELKNAMEDLGRVMQPLTEESNNLWNSIKVGAINALTPVMELIARMTDAGKLRNQLGNLNAPTGGMNSAVDAQLQKLRIAKAAGGSNSYVNSTYQGQIEEYNRTINAADKYVKQFESNRSKINTILQEASKEFGQKFGSMADLKAYQGAFKKMRDEYKQGAKEIMAPVKVDVKTSEAETNIESLKKKLADLDAQRKKAIKAGDTEKSKSLLKEINQTKADIRGLDPTALKTSTGSKTTPQEKADETYKKAQYSYQQALEQAALELKAGTINSAEAKRKELQATESLWKSIGDARETYDSPKLKEAQAKVEQDIVRLGGEVKKAADAQKKVEQAARELEQAQKKLADAQRKLAEAQKSGNLKDIYTAEKRVAVAQQEVTRLETVKVNVETGTVNLPDIPKEVEQVVSTKVGEVLTPDIATDIVQTISTRLGNIVTPEIAEQLTQTINTKVGEVVTPDIAKELTQTINTKVGEVVTPDIAKELTQVVNVVPGTVNLPDIPKEVDVTIKANTENIDAEIAHLKEKLSGLEIGSLDFNLTQGNLVDMTTLQTIINAQIKNGLKIDPEITKNLMNQIISGVDIADSTWEDLVSSINEKLKELNIEPIIIDFKTGSIEKETKKFEKSWQAAAQAVQTVGGAIQSLEDPAAKVAGTVAQAIANIALGYSQAMLAPKDPVSWIAFAATGLATMLTTISAIHSSTGYAQGGIVKGNSYSGDNIPAMVGGSSGELVGLNAGEVVLTKAQQGNLASQLEGNGGGGRYVPSHVSGEQIWIVLNAYTKRSGKGELVTWR